MLQGSVMVNRIYLIAITTVISLAYVRAAEPHPSFYEQGHVNNELQGMGMWVSTPAPHLVLRSPAPGKRHHPATIPHAVRTPIYKQPYAYGYFGAKPRRHYYRSFGHQESFTEWRLR